MFFYFFEARENPETAPIGLWFNGGPGCSSGFGAFAENGAYTLLPNMTFQENPYGWDTSMTMIYVDQPLGAGFSYTNSNADSCHDEFCVADDLLDFLLALATKKPELAGRDLYISGESYAGKYVPALGSRLVKAAKSGEVDVPFQLKGLAIGNGMSNPEIQVTSYTDYMLENGVINETLATHVDQAVPLCQWMTRVCNTHPSDWECVLSAEFCNFNLIDPLLTTRSVQTNQYDITKDCVGSGCYPIFATLTEAMNTPEMQEALGVNKTWVDCNLTVHSQMMPDWSKNTSYLIPEILEAGVRVLIYAGDLDFICNWIGNRRWMDEMAWPGQAGWLAGSDANWTVDGEVAGSYRTYGPLTFLKVYDAGHMVPMDQPKPALDMIQRFISNATFGN